MNILIAFGTTEGQTRKIARHLGDKMKNAGCNVTIHDCSDRDAVPAADGFDAVVVAASVHEKRYQPAVYDYVKSNLAALQRMPSAFVSVSLSSLVSDDDGEAQSYVDRLVEETGWQVNNVHLAEGAIRYVEYDFFKVQTIKHVVFKGKKEMPQTDGNPEFTDWDALDAFGQSFVESASG